MYVHHFVYYLIHNEHVACFYLLATTNNAAVYLGLQISLREQSIIILDTYSNMDDVAILFFFSFLGKFCTVPHNGCIILLSTKSI